MLEAVNGYAATVSGCDIKDQPHMGGVNENAVMWWLLGLNVNVQCEKYVSQSQTMFIAKSGHPRVHARLLPYLARITINTNRQCQRRRTYALV
jgi:hypothetical protein